jgi:Domain of unknown function (DUF2017)
MSWRRPKGPIIANNDGTFLINLTPDERATLSGFVDQLESLLKADLSDERLKRLYPVAYHDDVEKDAEYQGYMRDELTQSRAAAIDTVRSMLTSEESVTTAQLMAFMTVLNNLRLVLGTLLDVGEDTDEDDFEEDHPLSGQYQLYGYLGWLLEWTIATVSGQ